MKKQKTISRAAKKLGSLAEEYHQDAVAAGQDENDVEARNLLAFGAIANAPNLDLLLRLFAGELDEEEE